MITSIFIPMKISSYIFSTALTLIIALNSVKVTLTYAYYELDPIGFVEALCENKDKPELACNGKCHLAKVSKSQDKEQNTPESILDFKELTLYQNHIANVEFAFRALSNKNEPQFYQNLYSFTTTNDCFHPPRLSFIF
ncbi:hypothetical protein [Psychroserpens mesophilus]|uniref:hypothetical protein n=1 Tax=Psychroserpens mesophilus TaxID=325473 RepID=UPI003D662C89